MMYYVPYRRRIFGKLMLLLFLASIPGIPALGAYLSHLDGLALELTPEKIGEYAAYGFTWILELFPYLWRVIVSFFETLMKFYAE